ncbi:hypothetical protein SAMN02745121_05354 [Nannocystis exedens]|uniref:Uncharacterized protein n=1 Tax=Nannocystis exedens TaxID=54 RepID=A0A1I2CZ74_9BACT|nr:hypothetical protein [Nannocystis exedens]PCC68678.1 hypothetical protein NAEX_01695 [Nannocystis exedens]SFE73617.1 hypothetical protein SAMN02745121_05354 [Nannocystis exedens]
MPFSARTALLPLSALLLPACVPSIIVGDPQDSDPAPGTSEAPPDATTTTLSPTTSAGPPATASATDPASTADTLVSATDDATSTTTAGTTDALTSATDDTTSTTTVGTTDDTTGTAGTTTTTTGASTTDGGTTTVDPSDGTTTGPNQDPLAGCTLDAPAGTLVQGPSELGPFSSQRAYFGWIGVDEPFSPRIVLLSPGANAATELANVTGSSGMVADYAVWTDKSLEEGGWPGTWNAFAAVYDKGMMVDLPGSAVTITELAGNWDVADPADPPRLVGTIAGAISGSFNAVYCDKLMSIIIVE